MSLFLSTGLGGCKDHFSKLTGRNRPQRGQRARNTRSDRKVAKGAKANAKANKEGGK
jgi:hypothetical protein